MSGNQRSTNRKAQPSTAAATEETPAASDEQPGPSERPHRQADTVSSVKLCEPAASGEEPAPGVTSGEQPAPGSTSKQSSGQVKDQTPQPVSGAGVRKEVVSAAAKSKQPAELAPEGKGAVSAAAKGKQPAETPLKGILKKGPRVRFQEPAPSPAEESKDPESRQEGAAPSAEDAKAVAAAAGASSSQPAGTVRRFTFSRFSRACKAPAGVVYNWPVTVESNKGPPARPDHRTPSMIRQAEETPLPEYLADKRMYIDIDPKSPGLKENYATTAKGLTPRRTLQLWGNEGGVIVTCRFQPAADDVTFGEQMKHGPFYVLTKPLTVKMMVPTEDEPAVRICPALWTPKSMAKTLRVDVNNLRGTDNNQQPVSLESKHDLTFSHMGITEVTILPAEVIPEPKPDLEAFQRAADALIPKPVPVPASKSDIEPAPMHATGSMTDQPDDSLTSAAKPAEEPAAVDQAGTEPEGKSANVRGTETAYEATLPPIAESTAEPPPGDECDSSSESAIENATEPANEPASKVGSDSANAADPANQDPPESSTEPATEAADEFIPQTPTGSAQHAQPSDESLPKVSIDHATQPASSTL